MLKRTLSIFVALLFLLGTAGQAFADAAAELEQAESYHRVWNYEPAEAGYKAVIEQYPGTEYALDAYKKLIHLYIEWGKDQQADAALQQMLTDFADRLHDVMTAVLYIAEESVWSGKYENGRELFQYILDNHSQSEYAFSAQVSLVISNIWLGRVEVADAALEQLMTQYSEKENIAEAVRNIAQEYLETDKFEKSFGLYQYIVDNHPQSEHAMWAQAGVVMSNIGLGNEDAINAATDKLFTEFSDNPQIDLAIHDIANEFLDSGRYERAGELFQYVLDSWPDSTMAMWSQAGLVRANIALADDPNTQAAYDRLMADFSDDPNLAEGLYNIARAYETLDKYQDAEDTYQQILEQYPESSHAAKAQLDISKCQILTYVDAGDDPNAQTELDWLIADFNDHPDLPQAVFQVSEQYFYNDNYTRAIELWQLILSEYSGSFLIDNRIPYLLATCYKRQKDYSTAIEYYWDVIEHYTYSPYAHRAPYMLGMLYRRLGQPADAIYCFQQQRELYSDKLLAARALFFEGVVYLYDLNQPEQAAQIFEQYIQDYPEGESAAVAAYNLAACYEKMGSRLQAIELLQEALSAHSDTIYAKDISDKLAQLQ